jgi:hypothetical protein
VILPVAFQHEIEVLAVSAQLSGKQQQQLQSIDCACTMILRTDTCIICVGNHTQVIIYQFWDVHVCVYLSLLLPLFVIIVTSSPTC